MTGSHPSQWSSVVGKIARSNNDRKLLMNQRVGKIKPNLKIIDNNYLYYYLWNDKTTLKMANRASGSANQANISPDIIKDLEIIIPSLPKQRKIANLFLNLDNKIELNNKISRTLEETAQAIFKEWFVNFRFPRHEKVKMVDSELGEIPERWRVRKLGDLVHIDRGVSYNGAGLAKNGLPMINLGCFLRGGIFSYENLKFYTGRYRQNQLVEEGDIVIANTDITQNREILGNPAIVSESRGHKKFLFTHHVFALRNNSEYSNYFFYFLLRTPSFRGRAAGFATGTNVLALPKAALLELPIVLPQPNLISRFSEFANLVLCQHMNIEHENQKLAALRDLLLPKLMSGEIRV